MRGIIIVVALFVGAESASLADPPDGRYALRLGSRWEKTRTTGDLPSENGSLKSCGPSAQKRISDEWLVLLRDNQITVNKAKWLIVSKPSAEVHAISNPRRSGTFQIVLFEPSRDLGKGVIMRYEYDDDGYRCVDVYDLAGRYDVPQWRKLEE